MPSTHGINTGALGVWLTQQLAERNLQQYQLYYDHGLSTLDNVVAVQGFYGEIVSNQNRLADIDVMITTPEQEVVLLVEIEEGPSSPKKLLGDVLAILMCNQIAIRRGRRQLYFTISDSTQLIIAGVVPSEGNKLNQLEHTIRPRLQQFGVPSDAIPTQNITFLFRNDIVSTIESLKQYVLNLLEEQTRKNKNAGLM